MTNAEIQDFKKEKINEFSKDFILDSLKLIKNNQLKITSYEELLPILRNGKYVSIKKQKITDYDYFCRQEISKRLESLDSFELLNDIISEQPIKFFFRETHKKYLELQPDLVEKKTKDIIKIFLSTYLERSCDVTFSNNVFSETFESFYNFINNYDSDEYIIPLYNFTSDMKNKKLDFNGIILRQITPLELKIISNLEEYEIVLDEFTKLEYVLELHVKSQNIHEGVEKARKKFDVLVNALSLEIPGQILTPQIFCNINYPWKNISKNNFGRIFLSEKSMKFNVKEFSKIKKLFKLIGELDLDLDEHIFLKNAIERFRFGLNRYTFVDKIIDYAVSMECLYSSGPGDLTRKLSQRCSLLMGKNDNNREEILNFLKDAYNYRSKIIHGDKLPKVKLNGKILLDNEIVENLELINRMSLKKFFNLASNYKEKQKNSQIVHDLDIALINRKKLLEINKKSKN